MLDRDKLLKIFRRADEILSDRNIKGEITLFGGSALIFAFRDRIFTEDIDAYLAPTDAVTTALQMAAEDVAGLKHGEWISTDVLKYVCARPPKELVEVYDGKNLKVYRPTAEYLLAMKIFASRGEKDLEDAAVLAEHLKIRGDRAIQDVFLSVFPESYLSDNRILFIKRIVKKLGREQNESNRPR